jgi:PPK2 family polyphosphate:nucleotide phosphotransferase
MNGNQPLIPKLGSIVSLADYDPGYKGSYDKQTAREEVKQLRTRMQLLQEKLYAQGTQSLLIVLQAMDAGGKDGTIEHVFKGINPQGVQVTGFKAPTREELAHDFLWRIHQHTPPKGYMGIFNRSQYEDVLVVRVNNLVPPEVWQRRYAHINSFEQLLVDSGTHILKFFLYISKEEQKERFQDRLDQPEKNWKFSMGDLPVRERWDDYIEAYEAVLSKCNTQQAPWHIVPANRKWYRNLVISKTIVEALEQMNPAFPPPEEGLDQVVIPD